MPQIKYDNDSLSILNACKWAIEFEQKLAIYVDYYIQYYLMEKQIPVGKKPPTDIVFESVDTILNRWFNITVADFADYYETASELAYGK